MIDIHSHILFGVDDGPGDLHETLEMLQKAVDEGITEIISTSHSFHPQYNVTAKQVTEQMAVLQEQLQLHDIPLKLHAGQEVRLVENVVALVEAKEALTLANSDYLLLELPSSTIPKYTKDLIIALQRKGITPIIAHPERNKAIAERPRKLEELVREGAMAQITAGSLAGHFGKNIQKLSLDLVKANLVHTYGSDVHNLTTRPYLFDAGLTYLEKKKQLDAVDMLLENNARIIENKNFILYEPQEVSSKKWWSIF
ncbi:CpsB/CapC family capsule biosynthesis tyrosine phosphatase [Solibacillus sp. FSL W7-1464]|uniref:tyrosine-protein phosphatase n=1 Tax=Solibacillus sp. FSL W7-1464 TaxID=2921706 RepID=UPI0030F957D9